MSIETKTSRKRRVALIGPGSIGCCVAAALLSRGHEVVLAARAPFGSLTLETSSGPLEFAVQCVSDPRNLGSVDVLVLTTKAHQTRSVAPWLLAAAAQGAPIFVVQNGVDQVERTAAILADPTSSCASGNRDPSADLNSVIATSSQSSPVIVPAVVYCAAHRIGPGHAVLEGAANLIVPATDKARFIAELFAGSFMRIDVTGDWVTAAWNKLLINASLGPLCALTGQNIDVLHDAAAMALAQALVEEVIAVGRAAGARFAEGTAPQVLARALKNGAGHMPSIAQDRLAGLPTEWVARNDVVVRLGARYGVPVPLNSAMTTLMRLGEPKAE